MNDGEFVVDILDKNGSVIDKKLRKDIVKGTDIYHAVYGVIVTSSSDLVISVIGNPKGLPNLHAGKIGCTCATIRRTDETADQAIKRASLKELQIDVEPRLISEVLIDIDNTKRLVGFYVIDSDMPSRYNKEDIEELRIFSELEFVALLKNESEKITPPLKLFWSKYKK